MTNRLPDTIAARHRIIGLRNEEREYARKNRKVKRITILLEVINGRPLSTNLTISCNTRTGIMTIQSNSFTFFKHNIHPTTHRKRICTDEKVLKLLEDQDHRISINSMKETTIQNL